MFTALIALFFDDAMLLDSTVRSTLPHYRNTGLRLLQRYREPMQIMSFVCSEKKGFLLVAGGLLVGCISVKCYKKLTPAVFTRIAPRLRYWFLCCSQSNMQHNAR